MKKLFRYRYFLIATLLLLYGVLFNIWEAGSALPPKENFLKINAMPILRQDIDLSKKYVGYITPIQMVNMTANVTGYIDKVLISGGDEVKSGNDLVIIDQREYMANWQATKAATAQAQADLQNAKSYYNRVKKAGNKAFSAADIENYKSKYLAAKAALEQAKANEAKAKTLFDYTIIKAPIDGVVGNIDLTKGNYISQADYMFSIVQYDPIRVVFAVADKDYLQMYSSDDDSVLHDEKISLILPNGEVYPYFGNFKYSANMVDKSTNSISLYADFANPDKRLIADGYVDVVLQKKLKNTALIRQNYAVIKDDGIWAYFIKNKQLKQIRLSVLGEYEDFYAVANDFAPDDYLVIDKIGIIPINAKLKVNITDKEQI